MRANTVRLFFQCQDQLNEAVMHSRMALCEIQHADNSVFQFSDINSDHMFL